MLTLNNITKKYGTHVVLNNITLTIEPHTIVGLAGPSGGGKSTLLRCIQGLEIPDTGEINVPEKSGFMFQDFQLFPHMTVLENLTYAPKLHDKKKDHTLAALQLLEQLGIADKAKSFSGRLSGGQKQRVALARSLMMHPQLLLCDEPTSGLDVATIDDVVSLLHSVSDMGVSMIIASHDLDFLIKIADRVIILKGGDIVADVKPHDLDDPIGQLKGYY